MSENNNSSQEETNAVTQEESNMPTQDERNMAMFCHLGAFAGFIIPIPFAGIIVPLIIWQIKKDQSAYIDMHGKESVNFQITMAIAFLISFVLVFVLIGIPLLIGLAIFDLIIVIIAAIKANEGTEYRYPFSLRLIK